MRAPCGRRSQGLASAEADASGRGNLQVLGTASGCSHHVPGRLLSAPAAHGAYPGKNGASVTTAARRRSRLYTTNPDGSGTQQVTNGEDRYPVWSPDGERIAFVTARRRHAPARIRYRREFRRHRRHTDHIADAGLSQTPTWSPDGGRPPFHHRNGSNYQMWVVDVGWLRPRPGHEHAFRQGRTSVGLHAATGSRSTTSHTFFSIGPDGVRICRR